MKHIFVGTFLLILVFMIGGTLEADHLKEVEQVIADIQQDRKNMATTKMLKKKTNLKPTIKNKELQKLAKKIEKAPMEAAMDDQVTEALVDMAQNSELVIGDVVEVKKKAEGKEIISYFDDGTVVQKQIDNDGRIVEEGFFAKNGETLKKSYHDNGELGQIIYISPNDNSHILDFSLEGLIQARKDLLSGDLFVSQFGKDGSITKRFVVRNNKKIDF